MNSIENGNLLNIPGDLVDMHRKCWLVFSVWGEMVTPSRYHNIGSSDYNQTPSLPPLVIPLSTVQCGDNTHWCMFICLPIQ